jgi:hypothetical protein
MRFNFCAVLMLTFACALPASATVLVTSPTNGQTVGATVPFVATANTTTCSKGVASMGVYVDNKLEYVVDSASMNASLSLAAGNHNVAVQEWDFCGGATLTNVAVQVDGTDGIAVSSPVNGSTVGTPAAYVASATSSCAKGVAATGVYVDNVIAYVGAGASLNTNVAMAAGSHKTVVLAWDNCGGNSSKEVDVLVGSTGAKTISNVQLLSGWNQWGELAPAYGICDGTCNGAVTYSMQTNNNGQTLDGKSTLFSVGGTTPYSDVLFSNPVIGQGNTQGLNDTSHLILPAIHNFTLDMYTYVNNLAATQSLEYDINWYAGGVGMEFGTQCDHLGDGAWDIWNNVTAHWFSSGVACKLNDQAWNHVVIQVQREANNVLLYQTITVNGVVNTINQTVAPFAVPSGWYGMTVNFQMDGNKTQTGYSAYVDEMNFTYE